MKTIRSKPYIVGCSISLLVFLIAAVATTKWFEKTNDCFNERSPLKGFVFTIERSQQKQLVKQSQEFAENHEFSFNVAYFSSNGDTFSIDMIRKDVELAVSNNVGNVDKFYSVFYNYDCVHPTVAADIDDLAIEFKSLVSQIPSAMIIEEH